MRLLCPWDFPDKSTITDLTFMQITSCKMLGWMTHKLESRLLGAIPTTSDMQIIITLLAESLLMKVKEESEKYGLKLNIQKMKIMASGLITSWQIDRGKVTDFIFLGSKITVDSECSHEIKRCLLLGRKAMTNLDSVLRAETSLCRQRSI